MVPNREPSFPFATLTLSLFDSNSSSRAQAPGWLGDCSGSHRSPGACLWAESHYGMHRERPFFAGLVEFITSGPVVMMVWAGDGVIAGIRQHIGATKPLEAEPGTIRGDLVVNIGRSTYMVQRPPKRQHSRSVCGSSRRS